MSRHKELITLINLIYEAALDSDFWPSVLMALADTVGAEQIAMLSMDRRANVVSTFAPRLDPDLLAFWQKYWAFPVLARASLRPTGEIYTLDSLMPKFVATRFFNEFWRPAHLGLSAAGANLLVEDQFSALIFFSNAPDKEFLTTQQMHVFEVVLRHLTRAARISRRLWELEIEQIAAVERLESLQEGALLVDLGQCNSRERRRKGNARRRRWNISRQRTCRRRRLRNVTKVDCFLRANLSVAWWPRWRI